MSDETPFCVAGGHEDVPAAAVVVIPDAHDCGPDGECMGHWYCEECTGVLERAGDEVVYRRAS